MFVCFWDLQFEAFAVLHTGAGLSPVIPGICLEIIIHQTDLLT